MKVIGLTGGIGSGKSTVAGFLAVLGAVIIDADKVGHEILESDGEARRQAIDTFGQNIIVPGGKIDRKKLGNIVFDNPEALSRLNRIMHPRISEVVKAQLEQYRRQGVDIVAIEAPLLIEAGWDTKVDNVWVTTAPRAAIFKRLEQLGLSRTESMARIRSQLPHREQVKHADVVINTDCSIDELEGKVGKI
ncbi:MAG: dephospho-CoA kinase, partial [Dehalococcoidales bacterium]|nr:dephospho-CoA kinase [Dehalococcoidales bacterium]